MEKAARLSFGNVRTFSVYTRKNLVTIRNMARPYDDPPEEWRMPPEARRRFEELADRIVETRAAGKPVVWSMGAHVVKNGMSRYIIELVRHGVLTHVSGNGATSIHDFELALLGETSEDVARAIEDGSFGMWEETGRCMNEAIREGAAAGLGYGDSLHRYVEKRPERFPYREDCVFTQCRRLGVPYTCHISIGTDIIHQHPIVDFEALGRASGKDFETFCQSVAAMADGGVFLNFGSAVSGPELFLKALSLCRNQGLPMRGIAAANFDIVPVSAGRVPPRTEAEFHYRPRRYFVDLLGEIGGTGYLFHGLHQATIPHLFRRVLELKRERGLKFPPYIKEERLRRERSVLHPAARRPSVWRAGTTRETDAPHAACTSDTPAGVGLAWPAAEEAPFRRLVSLLRAARGNGREVLVSLGGNVVENGLAPLLAELMEAGWITHLAMVGAAACQDVEAAAFGVAGEKPEGGLAAGTLGMWREPGELVLGALRDGYAKGLGYGESLMAHMEAQPHLYPHSRTSLLAAALRRGIPCTVHVTLGTDAIHQHPGVDFGVQGGASGIDFQIYTATVSRLGGGVFLNFGSTVTGPEVFLKALSIARNLGHAVSPITTANFDIVKLGDYRKKVGYEDWDYYYRPRKNIIHRPTSLGGEGFHFEGLHEQTIPALHRALLGNKEATDR